MATTLAEREAAVRAELEGLTEAPDDFGTIQFGKRAGDATNVAAEQLRGSSAHEQLLALLADIERARAKLADGNLRPLRRVRRPDRRRPARGAALGVGVRPMSQWARSAAVSRGLCHPPGHDAAMERSAT